MAFGIAIAEALAVAVVDLLAVVRRRESPKVRTAIDGIADATTRRRGTTPFAPDDDGVFSGVAVFDASRAVALVGVFHEQAVTVTPAQPRSQHSARRNAHQAALTSRELPGFGATNRNAALAAAPSKE